jgi:DNA replication and repair protein RecF
VLLELDGAKREKFISVMPEYEQAFFTFLPGEPYNSYRKNDTMVYSMDSGCLK